MGFGSPPFGRAAVALLAVVATACAERAPAEPSGDAAPSSAAEPPAIVALPAWRGGQDLVGRALPPLGLDRWPRGEAPDGGSAVLYRWWTDTCPFCASSLPALEALRRRYEPEGVAFVAVYHPKPPRAVRDADVLAAADRLGWHGAVALDVDWSALDSFYLSTEERAATSASFLVDGRGVVRFVHPGPELFPSDDPAEAQQNSDHALLRAALEGLVEESRADAGR